MRQEEIEKILRDHRVKETHFISGQEVEITFTNETKAAAAIAEAWDKERQEAVSIIATLMQYGNIKPIRGVRYVQGTHEEFLEKAEQWLDKYRVLPPTNDTLPGI